MEWVMIGDDKALVNNKYVVNRNGDIIRWSNNHHKFEEQKKRIHSNGYLRGTIDGKDVYIHRLVASIFVGNPNGYKEVNHIDGNKKNNCADNLEWCTRSQNNKHAFQIGLRSNDEMKRISGIMASHKRLFDREQIKKIREMQEEGKTCAEVAKMYNCRQSTIWHIWKGNTYKEWM